MTQSILFQERRIRRSRERPKALRYLLQHARDRGGLEALVLSDREGLPLAQAGAAELCEELGAVAPLVGRTLFGFPMPPQLRGAEVAVRPLRVHGQDLYLACAGGSVARDALLDHAIAGVRRILQTN